MIVRPLKTRIFWEGEDIISFLFEYAGKLKERSVVVVTSKIIALSEGRTVFPNSAEAKEKIIKEESDFYMKTKHVWLTIKDGMVMANAGVDESNAKGKLILLPKDSFRSAERIRSELLQKFGLKRLGVLITDSKTVPLRAGVTGVALGYAGFCGVRDYRGKSDIFGRKFVYSRSNISDGLATAAVLTMGEGREKYPIAIIENAPVQFCQKVRKAELKIKLEDDMYRPLFSGKK
ncbi:MAG: hypothetical protein A3H57_02440 [Candidatus Taylorbacteria bacterium RIFCSPLOWO2_02_FULL_43_11]|uniref:Coenzyme F420:L-glutamate ligase-like domain-containing protein n=1 Tax=Candidatus Taylorbacteria bacterium RIFCSPHIGHO2_02_FULL_43_32b TaxID=1802306 RepID=A0A1G2MFX7_9BACT|nr:MAG: hypothetical protein A2743_00200 [Candidatus Taylorbacteria bacterium RIFCSPHIGHO2_01_FULL_43_47]OHA22788.1 MAG: hypothetical protein A3C72_02640 [Candidatus Taylorbacteria bacterium RIFCSPHIGHO2_02_FULL_43_32b]OHA30844.1 MAG: hypothetical protein A3B08_01455 [Candidatus Taylorbacteria bacterium RIFCSPLOWO2_01_FULL_43_44]OHA35240.1 MAG: hypothetical protein A3H57_02440 [Candidatus Taylorbacteria bacterium RIFCSPLOWO2_02_FULL_43_11]